MYIWTARYTSPRYTSTLFMLRVQRIRRIHVIEPAKYIRSTRMVEDRAADRSWTDLLNLLCIPDVAEAYYRVIFFNIPVSSVAAPGLCKE